MSDAAKIQRYDVTAGRPYARVAKAGGWIYTAGYSASRSGQPIPEDFAAQCAIVFDKAREAMDRVGASLQDIVSVTVYLTDAADVPALNEAFTKSFPSSPPTRATVVVEALTTPEKRVEMQFVAYVGE